jgi:hypothetical protein
MLDAEMRLALLMAADAEAIRLRYQESEMNDTQAFKPRRPMSKVAQSGEIVDIAKQVCKKHKVSYDDFNQTGNAATAVVRARHEAWCIAKERGHSTAAISRALNRDIKVIRHGIRSHLERMNRDD